MRLEHVHSIPRLSTRSYHESRQKGQLVQARTRDIIDEKDTFHRAVGPGESFTRYVYGI